VAPEIRTARDRLDRIASMVRRAMRFWLPASILLVFGCAVALAVAVTRPRIYKSETLILYREGIRSETLGGPDTGGDPARKLGLKLKEMVLSRTQLQHIIDQFKLYPAIVEDRGYVDAVDEMRNHIAFRVKDGDTFGLSFEGEDAKRVQQVTAMLAETLLDENTRSSEEQANVTKEFLDAEKQRTEAELKQKETNLARFLAKHPEFARETAQASGATQVGTAIRATGGQPKKGTSDPTLLALEREADRIRARLGVPTEKKSRKKDDVDPKLAAERTAAENDVAAAQKDLADKLSQYTEAHPDVRAAKQRLKTAQDRLRIAQDTAQAASPEAEPEPVVDRAAMEADLKRVSDEIADYKRKRERNAEPPSESKGASWIVALETEWTRLNREVTEAREREQQLQDKQFKASMQESAAASGRNAQMVVVDPAYKPTHPARPSRSLIAGAGVLVAIGLAMALALGCALLDDRLYDRVDVERLGFVSLLGVVPHGETGPVRRKGKLDG
jgi:uncharacterized protein involved in exopolysaccharide biosynthesis